MSRQPSRPASTQSNTRPTASHISPSSTGQIPPPNLTPTQQRLLEKQQEHEGLVALKKASGDMLEKVEELAKMGNIMADGGEAVGSVLRNWPHVFSILNLFDHSAPKASSSDTSIDDASPDLANTEQQEVKSLPQLVRLAYGGGPGEEPEMRA